MKLVVMAARIIALAYVGFCILLFFLQRRFIYYPRQSPLNEQLDLAGPLGLVPWRNAAGQPIGWRTAENRDPPARRWVVFHGNAGQAIDRDYFVQMIAGSVASGEAEEIYILEYPGYGARPGKPTEESLTRAAMEAVTELAQPGSPPLVLLGESLGTGLAAAVAGAFPDWIAGVVLITPFANLADVGAHHYPFFPVRWLLFDQYRSDKVLGAYKGPVAFVLVGRDKVVPPESGWRLFKHYSGVKRMWVLKDAGHNEIVYWPVPPWWHEVRAFIKTVRVRPSS